MGVFKFIIGVLGVLLILGTMSAFLPLIFLGSISSGSVGGAFALPIFLFVIGAVMVYFGFYYHGSSSSSGELSKFLKWGVIHSIGLYVGLIIIQKIGVSNILIKYLLLGALLAIVASIINKVYTNKKRQFLSYALHIVSVWIAIQYVVPLIGISDYIASIIFSGFFIHTVFIIFKRLGLHGKEIPVSILLLVVFIIFNLSSLSNISLGNIDFSNLNLNQEEIINVSPECEARAFQVIGDKFTINYEYGESDTQHGWISFYVKFPNERESFDSAFGYQSMFLGMKEEYKPGGTTSIDKRKSSYRLGSEVGENKRWLYGSTSYEYSYLKKDITDNQGIILGDNYFTVKVNVEELSNWYAGFYKQGSGMFNPDVLSIPSRLVVQVTKCNFVN